MDDNKKSTTIWLRPSVISRMDGWLEADNCQSRSEFVDKALRFYMGYLGTEDNTTYISRAILTAIQGTLDDNNNRLCRRSWTPLPRGPDPHAGAASLRRG